MRKKNVPTGFPVVSAGICSQVRRVCQLCSPFLTVAAVTALSPALGLVSGPAWRNNAGSLSYWPSTCRKAPQGWGNAVWVAVKGGVQWPKPDNGSVIFERGTLPLREFLLIVDFMFNLWFFFQKQQMFCRNSYREFKLHTKGCDSESILVYNWAELLTVDREDSKT